MTDRARQASRQATKAINGYTEADIAWTEERTIDLMQKGVSFMQAVSQAAEECTLRILNHKIAVEDEARVRRETEQSDRRAELQARGELGQRPTLKTTLGDLLAARRRV